MRQASISRQTKETDISATLRLDGTGVAEIATGVGFFDHMLDQLARHGGLDLTLTCRGDLHIDAHHTVEDCGIVLGQALAQALGDKRGVERYGHAYAPMDEALARAAIDLSGRPHLSWRVRFTQPRLGEMDSELVEEFFKAVAQHGKFALHVDQLAGENNHHIVEACFKATARALKAAVKIDPARADAIPSTKGAL
ncbi:MAG: imidazoleglycerol-phosphate dehydratase HisB [Rhodothalassiaceae bacterium]